MMFNISFGLGISVDEETFMEIFADAFPEPTFDKLMEIDQGRRGYEEYFKQLKEEGILN